MIDNILTMLFFITAGILVFIFGLKKTFKNTGSLFYESGLILLLMCVVLILMSFFKIVFSIMDM
jgi:hypothetical protein